MLLGKYAALECGLVYGGIDYQKQRLDLASGVDILIGTPGRIIDYFKQQVFDLRAIEVVVLDEADRMFDLGFIRDVRYLLRRMPPPERRLNMLFSATLSLRVNELAYEHMNGPQLVEVTPEQVTVDTVDQILYHVEAKEKPSLLIGLFQTLRPRLALVFVNTKRTAEAIRSHLKANGYDVGLLSGDVPQHKRQGLIRRFSTGDLPVLVATDVAARGLHVSGVSHVFNYDLPQSGEDYVHRIGRTARAGAGGDAISLVCEKYVYSLTQIEDYIGHKIPVGRTSEELMATLKHPRTQRPRRRRRPRSRATTNPADSRR